MIWYAATRFLKLFFGIGFLCRGLLLSDPSFPCPEITFHNMYAAPARPEALLFHGQHYLYYYRHFHPHLPYRPDLSTQGIRRFYRLIFPGGFAMVGRSRDGDCP